MTLSFEEWFAGAAPPDVLESVEWLEAFGFTRVDHRDGPGGSGNALLRLDSTDIGIVVTRDRGQWMLDFDLADGTRLDMDAVVHARSDSDWEIPDRQIGDPLPEQLPEGIRWLEEIPHCLSWLRNTPEATGVVEAAKRRRAKKLFG